MKVLPGVRFDPTSGYRENGMSGIPIGHMTKAYRFDSFRHMSVLQKEVSYFLAVADSLNVSKAAESMGLQQSALSRAILRLEEDLGQKLFRRRSNGVSLTTAGEQFLTAVKVTKDTWESAIGALLYRAETPTGLVKFGFHSSLGQKYFPLVSNQFTDLFPGLELEATTLSSLRVARRVNEQTLDFGLVVSRLRFPELVGKKVGSDFVGAFQKDPHHEPKRLVVNPDMLASASVFRRYSGMRKLVISDYDIIAQVCSRGGAIGFLPQSVAERYPGLQLVGKPHLRADVFAIVHKDKLAAPAYRKMFEALTETCLRGSSSASWS